MIKITLKQKLTPHELKKLEDKLQTLLNKGNYKAEIKNDETGNEMTIPTPRTFKIRLELDTLNYVSPILEIETKDWEGVCEEIFGKLAIIDTEEDDNNEKKYKTSHSTSLLTKTSQSTTKSSDE